MTSTSSLDRNSSGLISAYLNATPSSTLLVDSKRNKYELIENLRSQIMAASEEYSSYLNASTLQKMSKDLRASSYVSLNNARYGLCENPQPNIGVRKLNDYDLEAGRHLSESPQPKSEYYHSSNLLFNDQLYSTPLNDLNKPNLRQSSSLVRAKYNSNDKNESQGHHYLSSNMFANTNEYYPQMNYLSTFGRSCLNQNKTKASIPASLIAPPQSVNPTALNSSPPLYGDRMNQRPFEADALEAEFASCHNCLKRNSDLDPSRQQTIKKNSDPYTISETLDQSAGDIYSKPGARIFPRTNPKCRNAKSAQSRNSLAGLSCSEFIQPDMTPYPTRHSLSSADLDNLPVYCSKL